MNKNSQNTGAQGKRATNRALDPLKFEIANELGVELGANTTARQNGSVGGEITKRLVSYAKSQMLGKNSQ